MIYAVNDKNKIKGAQHGGVHPKARSAWLKSTRRGSLPQSRFRTECHGIGAGAPPKGIITIGLPGPIPDG